MAIGTLTVKDSAGNTQTLAVDVQGGVFVPLNGRYPTALADTAAGACSGTVGAAVMVVPYSAARKWLAVFNRTTGSETIDLGVAAGVAVLGGIPAPAGGGYVFDGPGAAGPIYAVSPVASTPFSYAEA